MSGEPSIPEMPFGTSFYAEGRGDRARFVRLFCVTMDGLPDSARDAMVKSWISSNLGRLEVRLFERHATFAEGSSEGADSQCEFDSWGGTRLTFRAPVVDRIADEHACTLIAHELAHAYLVAFSPEHAKRSAAAQEAEVAGFLPRWGYSIMKQVMTEQACAAARRKLRDQP